MNPEIAPGGSKRGTKAGTAIGGSGMGTAAGGSAAGTKAGTAVAPAIGGRGGRAETVFVERADPLAPVLGGASLGASIFVILGGFALISAVLDTKPALLEQITTITKSSILFTAGLGLGLIVICAVGGAILGKISK